MNANRLASASSPGVNVNLVMVKQNDGVIKLQQAASASLNYFVCEGFTGTCGRTFSDCLSAFLSPGWSLSLLLVCLVLFSISRSVCPFICLPLLVFMETTQGGDWRGEGGGRGRGQRQKWIPVAN